MHCSATSPSISARAQRHLKALSDLFVQVLKLCRAAGLVRLGHVALDGTKVAANASVHKAMSYGRMQETEKRLAAEVSDWLTQAEATDAEEDRTHGGDRRGDEMRDSVANRAAAPPKRRSRPKPNSRRPTMRMDRAPPRA